MGMWKQARGSEDARQWLSRHRLPVNDATVDLVARRLRARRRGWWIDRLVFTGMALVGWWALAQDQLWSGRDLTAAWLPVVVTGCVAGDVVRRWVMWSRWDHRELAAQQVRVASLRRPTWDDLVGRRFVQRAAVLVGVVLLVAVEGYRQTGAAEAAAMAFIALSAAAHVVLLLEIAQRRPLPAGDEAALAVNDRLRGEEANHAATDGLIWVVLAPVVVWGSNVAVPSLVFIGYLYAVSAVRHRYAYEQIHGRLVAK
jgi:hypothetical protein